MLRECPRIPRVAPRTAFSLRERFFKIGVVPRLRKMERNIGAKYWSEIYYTVRVKIITGSLVTLENLLPQNYRYRYCLEIWVNSFSHHYRYRLGVRSHPLISIDSHLPSSKSFEVIFVGLLLLFQKGNAFKLER